MVAIFCYLFPKMWLFLILWQWREKWLFLIILWLKSMKMFWQHWLDVKKNWIRARKSNFAKNYLDCSKDSARVKAISLAGFGGPQSVLWSPSINPKFP